MPQGKQIVLCSSGRGFRKRSAGSGVRIEWQEGPTVLLLGQLAAKVGYRERAMLNFAGFSLVLSRLQERILGYRTAKVWNDRQPDTCMPRLVCGGFV